MNCNVQIRKSAKLDRKSAKLDTWRVKERCNIIYIIYNEENLDG